MTNNGKGKFNTNFGFLMAAIGSAIGLGNIWGFPYKMGANGGFAFLIIYVLLVIFIGYPLMLGEISLGRKTGKAAIEAYREADSHYTINGVFETIVPCLLLCFYCVLGGIILKYIAANFCDIFGLAWGVNGAQSDTYFATIISSPVSLIIYTLIFIILTAIVVEKGVHGGIERVCAIGMPALFVMLIITIVKCVTLPGAKAGLIFMFKPNFSVFTGAGWLRVFAVAGSQMFFSLSLASGALIAYGSYMRKKADLEKDAIFIPLMDTIAALLAGMAVLPAVFAEGIAPTSGPGLLFVSLQSVFDSMGSVGPYFGLLFYILVFVAAFTSSIGMMEGAISAIMDSRIKHEHPVNRNWCTALISVTTIIGAVLVAMDGLGSNTSMWKPFGLASWLDVFDLGAEGILMPLGGLLMAFLLGWSRRGYLDDEIASSSTYRTRKFVNLCWRWLAPIFMIFILFIQFSSFFFSKTSWYIALMG